MWEQRSKWVFLTSQFTFVLIILQMGLYLSQIWSGKIPMFNVYEFCSSWIKSIGFTGIDYLLGALVVYTGIQCLWIVGKQLYLSRQTYKNLLLLQNIKLTTAMNAKGNSDILVVNHLDAIAITMGFIAPKIILSTGLLQMLEEDELEAVILHENFHRQNKDPLRLLLMFMSSSILWYIPILKWNLKQFKVTRELMADSYSMRITGSAEGIGSALLKLVRNKQAKAFAFSYASFAENSVNFRIKQIMDPQIQFSFRLPISRMIISLLVILALSAMLIFELL